MWQDRTQSDSANVDLRQLRANLSTCLRITQDLLQRIGKRRLQTTTVLSLEVSLDVVFRFIMSTRESHKTFLMHRITLITLPLVLL